MMTPMYFCPLKPLIAVVIFEAPDVQTIAVLILEAVVAHEI